MKDDGALMTIGFVAASQAAAGVFDEAIDIR